MKLKITSDALAHPISNGMNKKTCVLILENIRSVENTGSIFRTAKRFGVSKIILIGTTPTPLDRFGRKRQDFAKVSLGAEEIIDWEYVKEISPAIDELKNDGFQIVSLEQDSQAINLKDLETSNQFTLIVGNEVSGVSQEALKASNVIVEIPVQGEKKSLNVSVATGVALFMLLSNHA